MAQGKTPPPRRRHPDYNPEPPAREELGDDLPRNDEYRPARNRSAPSVAMLVTIVLFIVGAAIYFIGRG